MGAEKWPQYDEVKRKPTKYKKYWRVLLVTQAPDGTHVSVGKNAGSYQAAHSDAYQSLLARVKQHGG